MDARTIEAKAKDKARYQAAYRERKRREAEQADRRRRENAMTAAQIAAQIKAETYAPMGDGRAEVDDAPPGVAPRGGRGLVSRGELPALVAEAKKCRRRWRRLAGKPPEAFAAKVEHGPWKQVGQHNAGSNKWRAMNEADYARAQHSRGKAVGA